ncbi:hypothetical protein VTK26DRAFT_4924 [Humicola hyalothermophila]
MSQPIPNWKLSKEELKGLQLHWNAQRAKLEAEISRYEQLKAEADKLVAEIETYKSKLMALDRELGQLDDPELNMLSDSATAAKRNRRRDNPDPRDPYGESDQKRQQEIERRRENMRRERKSIKKAIKIEQEKQHRAETEYKGIDELVKHMEDWNRGMKKKLEHVEAQMKEQEAQLKDDTKPEQANATRPRRR